MAATEDFIYNTIFRAALKVGTASQAKNAAVIGLERYKRNQYKTVTKLVEEMIKNAKKGLC